MNKSLMIVLVFLMFILVGTVSFGMYYIYSNMPKQEKIHAEEKIVEEESKEPLLSYDYKDAIFNISNSKAKEKMLKLSFTLKLSGKKEDLIKLEAIKANMDDAIISIISSADSDILLKLEGKVFLKDELQKQLGEILVTENIPLKINKILITGMVIK